MKKVTKILTTIVIVLLVLILAVVLVFKLYGNQLIKTGIIAGSEKALGVGVRLDSVDLKLLAGQAELKNMEIDNPEGYEHPTFLKMGRAYMDLDVSSLTSDTVELTTLQLDNIALVIEQKGTRSNLSEILDNLPKSDSTEPEPETKPAESEAGKNIRINVLEINNVEVKAKLLPIPGRADTVTLRIKPIRLENVGSNEKVNAAELTAKIIKAIAKGVAEQGTELLPTDMMDSISDELAKQGETLQKAGQELLESGKGIGQEATDAIKGLGGLFQKKEEE